MAKNKLPAPRIQFRWQPYIGTGSWECHYELVIALRKHDIRAEQKGPRGGGCRPNLKELVVPIKPPSFRSSSQTPCTFSDGIRFYDPPYIDGAHAMRDAEQLGNLPIYVIAPDGMAFSKAEDDVMKSEVSK